MAEGDHDDILALDTGGHYELPGGIVNYGEEPREAAEREVLEETGFDVEIGDLLDIRVSDSNGSIMYFFEGKVVGGEKEGSWEGDPEFVDKKKKMEEKVWRLEHSHVHEYLFPEE
jgi:8-oxo-dGTP pyrophosphatase MutT (NUDIX family)